ncbi:hypothetical protein GNF85_13940 [Clostridium perfringens]
MVSKITKGIMAGVLISTVAIGGPVAKVYASDNSTKDSVCYNEEKEMTLQDYLNEMKFLSNDEKQKLIDADNESKPYYDKVNDIENEIEKISNKILNGSDNIYDRYDEILKSHEGLWEKLYSNITDEQTKINSDKELIKASKILTEEEKNILIDDQIKLDEIYKKLDERNNEVNTATESLNKQLDEIYSKIDDINKKNNSIWEKVDYNYNKIIK